MNLAHARLDEAQMQAADLSNTQMQGASLKGAQMQRALILFTQMQRARLFETQLQGANIKHVEMQWAILSGAQMQGATLYAQMQGAHLNRAEIDASTFFEGADLQGACLRGVKLWADRIDPDRLRHPFGDQSVEFRGDWPDGFVTKDAKGIQRADTTGALSHWSPETLFEGEIDAAWCEFQKRLDAPPADAS